MSAGASFFGCAVYHEKTRGVLMKRIFLIVLDNKGIGAAGDAEEYGEKGTDIPASAASGSLFPCPT